MRSLSCALVVFAVLAASEVRAAGGEPIRIGQVLPVTGEAAEAGRYHKYGAELAIEQVNKSGGIKGRKIELVQEDDKTTNPGAVAALQRLLEDKDMPAVIGSIRSTQVQAMLPTVKEAGIPFMIGGTNYGLTHQGNPWVFRFRPHDGFSAKVIARFAVEELNLKKVAVIHSTDAFGSGGRDMVVKALGELKAQPVLVQGFNNGEKDFTAILTALRQSGADGLITYFTFSTDNGIFAKQLKQLGIKATWIGSPAIVAIDGRKLAGDAALYIRDFSPEEIARLMLQLATSPDVRRSLIRAGHRRVKKFTWRETSRKTAELYENIIEHPVEVSLFQRSMFWNFMRGIRRPAGNSPN